jgi:rhamnulokinase
MPDLLNYWLTGEKVSEFSIATTTQCYDPRAEAWATEMLKTLGIPAHIFPAIVPTGTVLGPVLDYVAEELGVEGTPIIAPACHDTGSAVAAVPAENEDFVYISCGTWSLMGTELREPLINDDSLAFSVTNEGGVGGTFRFLKNITGLWLVQESRRTWQQQEGQELSWDDLTQMAAEAEPLRSVIDPDDVAFLHPGDMPAHIRDYCRRTGQPAPETKGAVIRCALESLALKYRYVLSNLEQILGRTLTPIHMVGGGIQNRLLCQFTADATGRCVVTGPVEATATGNLLTQAMALGHIGSISEIRQVVRDSFEIASLEPTGDGSNWNEAYGKLLELIEG